MGSKRLFVVKEIDKRLKRAAEGEIPIAIGGGAVISTPVHAIDGPEHSGRVITSWKQAVRAATTAAGTLATSFENGDTIDGVVLATGDRILIKDQAADEENGIYVVAATGAPTRATDANIADELTGAAVVVTNGTANADKIFICTTNPPITLETTGLTWDALSASAALIVQENDVDVDTAVTTLDFGTALNVTSSPAGEANVAVDLGTGATQAAAGNHAHTPVGNWLFVIGNGQEVISTGIKFYWRAPFAGTITRWTLLADVSGAIKVDIWKDSYANFPPTDADSITNAQEPEIVASGVKAEDDTISTWVGEDFLEGDTFAVNVDSATSVKRVMLELKYVRT